MERPERNAQVKVLRIALAFGTMLTFSGVVAWSQTSTSGSVALPSAEQVIQRVQDPYLGSVPQGQVSPGTIDLSLEEALDRGLKYNLGLYLSDRATEQTRGARLQALSEMLPHIAGSLTEEEEKVNLKALGFTGALIPGIPPSVGPFSVFDLRATGSWDVLNLHNIDNLKASDQNVKAAQFNYRDARDTVVLAVGANYLLTIANESRVAATEAELQTAQALYQLASDQEAAGLAPNIDTLRARVQLQAQQSALIQAQNSLEKQRIALARVIGLPVTQKFRLVNRVPYHPLPPTEEESAYALALRTRPDYQAALALVRAAQLNRDASWKQRLPSISFSGEYGVLGNQPSAISPNWTAAASLNIPIWQGGRYRADEEQAEAILKQRQAQADNLKAGIEQEIQDSLLDLRAAAEEVEVARIGLDYAQQTLTQSQDRFSAGVTNNVEVIQAQQQLASANDQYITSLYAHNIAKVLLARAIGNAEQVVKQYLAEPGSTAPANPPVTPQGQPNPSTPQTTGPSAELRGTAVDLHSSISQQNWSPATTGFRPTTLPQDASSIQAPANTLPKQ
jgi:outer membrane protein TolC